MTSRAGGAVQGAVEVTLKQDGQEYRRHKGRARWLYGPSAQRLPMSSSTVALSDLESHLWESANNLRGPVDAADFKTYIFPLLFFKRICDVWDDEYQEIVDETGDEQLAWFPESHRFQIPEECHWNDVRGKASNVGAAPTWDNGARQP